MAVSKVVLQYQKSDAFKEDGEVTWCKYLRGFPELRTHGEEYKDWWNAMKSKMDQDRILGWTGSTAAQWAAIQVYALATLPVTVRAALWQTDSAWGERFTQYLHFLLKDIAKKDNPGLTGLLVAQPVPAVAPVAAPIVDAVAV